jgi:NH3-dependent NAD+ synthetase
MQHGSIRIYGDRYELSYEELDRYLLTGKAGAKIRQKIESLIVLSNHKRQPPPLPDF